MFRNFNEKSWHISQYKDNTCNSYSLSLYLLHICFSLFILSPREHLPLSSSTLTFMDINACTLCYLDGKICQRRDESSRLVPNMCLQLATCTELVQLARKKYPVVQDSYVEFSVGNLKKKKNERINKNKKNK